MGGNCCSKDKRAMDDDEMEDELYAGPDPAASGTYPEAGGWPPNAGGPNGPPGQQPRWSSSPGAPPGQQPGWSSPGAQPGQQPGWSSPGAQPEQQPGWSSPGAQPGQQPAWSSPGPQSGPQDWGSPGPSAGSQEWTPAPAGTSTRATDWPQLPSEMTPGSRGEFQGPRGSDWREAPAPPGTRAWETTQEWGAPPPPPFSSGPPPPGATTVVRKRIIYTTETTNYPTTSRGGGVPVGNVYAAWPREEDGGDRSGGGFCDVTIWDVNDKTCSRKAISAVMPVLSPSSVFVLDNGGGTLKAGFSNQGLNPRIIPNCITKAKSEKRRAFVGDQIDDCRDLSSLFYMLSYQKGYLVNWDHQKTVWDYTFGKSCFNLATKDMSLIITEPYFNFASIKEGLSEILFEEYQFDSVFRTNPGDLSCYKNRREHPQEHCCLVVDSGYSFTHIVPYVNGRRVREAVVRVDVGGKLLTNHLKEIISYRQIHVLDETYVINAAKEDSCYVSLDFDQDMKVAKAESRKRRKDKVDYKIAKEYVLPDFTALRRGYLRDIRSAGEDESEQTIVLNNERIAVPELLFNPSDVGIMQMGIPEAIAHSISQCDPSVQPWLYKNIVLTGGNCFFPNIRERVEREVREHAPDLFEIKVRLPSDPLTYAWQGGTLLAEDSCLANIAVTRDEYLEHGNAICEEKYYL